MQLGEGSYLGGDVAAVLNVSARELANIASDTFQRGNARVFRVMPGAAAERRFTLATSGDDTYDEPPRHATDLPKLTRDDVAPHLRAAPFEHTLPNGLRMILVPRRRDAPVAGRRVRASRAR